MPFRSLLVVSVLVLVAVAAALVHARPVGTAGHRAVVEAMYAGPGDPLTVLHAWDRRRAAAWARGDAVALGELYVPGSADRTADLALLRRYTTRGLVVRGLAMQVLRARVVVDRPRVLVLEVTERLAPARAGPAGEPGRSRVLPAGGAGTHLVRFRKVAGEWLVAAVSQAGPPRR